MGNESKVNTAQKKNLTSGRAVSVPITNRYIRGVLQMLALIKIESTLIVF